MEHVQAVAALVVHAVKAHPGSHGHPQPDECEVCLVGSAYLHTPAGRAEYAEFRRLLALAPVPALV